MTSRRWMWVACASLIVATLAVLDHYGGASFWPGLVGGFGASLAAFVLALSWESEKERRRSELDAHALRGQRQQEAKDLEDRLRTEIRRRLGPIREELQRNKKSIEALSEAFANSDAGDVWVRHPELLDGAWAANAPRLSAIVADYELMSKLASTYGRIEELRWRLRQRTATLAVTAGSQVAQRLAEALETIAKPLVGELLIEVTDLLNRVGAEIDKPHVQQGGLLHVDAATVTLHMTAGSVSADDVNHAVQRD